MTKKKNRVILSICAIFVCICSLLCFVPMFKNDKIDVYADEVVNQNVEFIGSNIYIFCDSYPTQNEGFGGFMSRSYSFIINTSTNSLVSFTIKNNHLGLITTKFVDSFSSASFDNQIYLDVQENYFYSVWFNSSNYSNGVVTMGVPISCSISSAYIDNQYIQTYVTYYDINSNSINFTSVAPFVSSGFGYDVTNMLLSPRTYYFSNNLNLSDNQYYNQGYSQGKLDGKNEGIAEGQTQGYNQGFSEGKNIGFNDGYSQGVESANDYTFMSLLSATIDAPVKYFQSLFNFELLGVNLQGFLTGLFTLCVVVTIFKLALGG